MVQDFFQSFQASDRRRFRAMPRRLATCGIAALSALALWSWAATAQSVQDFYRGKSIQLAIGFGPGASYDGYARLLAEFLGRHIPGEPRVVAVNMEGAGSLRVANWLYSVAPKDGTALGTTSRAVPFAPLIGTQGGVSFDSTRFTWIGSINNEVSTCVAWKTSGITAFEQLRERELIIGGDGPSADGEQFARVMNEIFSTKIKIVSGYPGGNAVNLAMERGEVQGRCGWSWSGVKAERRQWVENGMINIFVQLALSKHRELPDVPLIMDLAQSDEQRQMLRLVLARQPLGRPFYAPPDVPPERAAALRRAFVDTMQDADFQSAASKAQLEINPLSGTEVEAIVRDVFATTSAQVIARTKELLSRK
jgi:tripartite-type tricarboxylate transporter receptor subunit TctC